MLAPFGPRQATILPPGHHGASQHGVPSSFHQTVHSPTSGNGEREAPSQRPARRCTGRQRGRSQALLYSCRLGSWRPSPRRRAKVSLARARDRQLRRPARLLQLSVRVSHGALALNALPVEMFSAWQANRSVSFPPISYPDPAGLRSQPRGHCCPVFSCGSLRLASHHLASQTNLELESHRHAFVVDADG